MGCSSSSHRRIGLHFNLNPLFSSHRAHDDGSPLHLCRDRTELIHTAGDRRYGAAAAHAAYLQSVVAFSESLCRFAADELLCISVPGSPVLTLPSSKGKSKKSDSESVLSSVSSLSHSLSFEDDEEGDEKLKSLDSNLKRTSNSSTVTPLSHDISIKEEKPPVDHSTSLNGEASRTSNFQMRSSGANPSAIYGSDPYGYGYGYEYPYGSESLFPNPNSNPNFDDRPGPSNAAAPPAPVAENSTWGFLDPFSNYDSNYDPFMMYYSDERFKYSNAIHSIHSSPDSDEIRKQEGIPELEEENQFYENGNENGKGKEKEKEKGKENEKGKGKGKEKEKSVDPTINVNISTKGTNDAGSNGKDKAVKFKEDKEATNSISTATSNSENSLVVPSMVITRDLNEVIEAIKTQFHLVVDSANGVSDMLEVGKVQHQSGLLGVMPTTLPVLLTSCLPHNPSTSSTRKTKNYASSSRANAIKSNGDLNSDSLVPTNLSLTLEKLYVWEKRLYKEVEDEEKLRTEYDKKYKRLKYLDEHGAEWSTLNSTREIVKSLQNKITVVMKSVHTVSKQIHFIRDQELQPQLVELVQGLIKMWKSILKCHTEQLHAIISLNSENLKAQIRPHSSRTAKSTLKLEKEISKWRRYFKKWMTTQKSFIEALNGYLILWIQQEKKTQEENVDGVPPFSPGRLGAPASFVISNDWHQAAKNISESKILESISEFGYIVRDYKRLQVEENRLRTRSEYFSRVYQKKLKALQDEIGTHNLKIETRTGGEILEIVSQNKDESENPETESHYRDYFHQIAKLEETKRRRDEERQRHKVALEKVHDFAASVLKTGLVPVFEELVHFVSENLKAYEEVRIVINQPLGGINGN